MNKILSFFAFLLIATAGFSQNKQLDLGGKVPEFTLPDQNGKTFSMADSIGTKMLVIFFYPKDENILCTKELVAFNDSIDKFNKAEALVVGISEAGMNNLKKFSKDHSLKYELLCDSTGAVLKKFGVKENFLSNRVTYVGSISGKVVFKSYSKADGKKHVQEVLDFLRQWQKQ
ncbi:MAG: peroxiredoxin [Bacteroidia bacterium]